MKAKLNKIAIGVFALQLVGCASESSDEESVQSLTVAKVNQLIEDSYYHNDEYKMTCGEGALSGCFVSTACHVSSQYYSTKIAYSFEQTLFKAFMISYQNDRCAGSPGLHPSVWSVWQSEISDFDEFTNQANLTLNLVRYGDGFVFDSNKPKTNIDYKSEIWIDNSGDRKQLCLSEDLIDPQRPLKFMDVSAPALDPNNCAKEMN